VKLEPDQSGLPPLSPADYVALISRGHATDELALRLIRGVPLAYLGMIGSNAKKKSLYDRLRAEGWGEAELAAIHCPIGLKIGAETPEEIAVSILAEIVSVRRRAG
jgi:xanthine dehydrogenase accessory factor